jgi:uncharacterized membrane protein YfcA
LRPHTKGGNLANKFSGSSPLRSTIISAMIILSYLLLGVAVGVLSGMIGIGGGIIIVPSLVYFAHMSQHKAQGTSLAALILPIGIFAAYEYFKAGNMDIKAGLLIAAGFALGGYFGGLWAQQIPDFALRKVFAVILFLVSVKMFFQGR